MLHHLSILIDLSWFQDPAWSSQLKSRCPDRANDVQCWRMMHDVYVWNCSSMIRPCTQGWVFKNLLHGVSNCLERVSCVGMCIVRHVSWNVRRATSHKIRTRSDHREHHKINDADFLCWRLQERLQKTYTKIKNQQWINNSSCCCVLCADLRASA